MASKEGVERIAETALRTLGGWTAMLRMPAPASAGSSAEELGLATPQFQDFPLGPATFRKAESTAKLLVAASAVKKIIGAGSGLDGQFDSADVLFEEAAGVVVDGVVYEITDSVALSAEGGEYCWCLSLKAPVR